ncbi:hypothetical protein BH23ACI1_BH23ACI1_15030 [soil metagenome]|nr:hypothetical protein [Acidobacteriota bacterium]
MRPHLQLLGILQIGWGALGLLLGVVVLLLAISAVAIGISAPNERMAAGITAAGFVAFSIGLLAGGSANAWAGRALRRRQAAGRTATLWLAVLNLFVLPFGTALGIYAFWVLLHDENRAVFVSPDAEGVPRAFPAAAPGISQDRGRAGHQSSAFHDQGNRRGAH